MLVHIHDRVIFFHPFAVFARSRGADDPDGLWHLAHVIERALGTRR